MTEQPALFDSARAALSFALNADNADMPVPFMNKAMSAVPAKPGYLSKTLGDVPAEDRPSAKEFTPGQRLRGLDAAGQAGMILRHLARQEPEHQAVLIGMVARTGDRCPCQRPCCSGWLPNPRWTSAVASMCDVLKNRADVLKKPGRRGFSTHPEMRRTWVEFYFRGRGATLADIAKACDVNVDTAAVHRDLIWEYMKQCEAEAWQAIDAVFDAAQITGAAL